MVRSQQLFPCLKNLRLRGIHCPQRKQKPSCSTNTSFCTSPWSGMINLKHLWQAYNIEHWFPLKGFRTILPKMCHIGMWTIWSWRQSRPQELKRNLYPFHKYLEKSKLGSFQNKGYYWRQNLCEWPICMGRQTSNYQASVHTPCELLYSPLKPQALNPLLSSVWHIYPILPFCIWISLVSGIPIHMQLNLIFSC